MCNHKVDEGLPPSEVNPTDVPMDKLDIQGFSPGLYLTTLYEEEWNGTNTRGQKSDMYEDNNTVVKKAVLVTNTEPGQTANENSKTTSGSVNLIVNIKVTTGHDIEEVDAEVYNTDAFPIDADEPVIRCGLMDRLVRLAELFQ